MSYRFGNNSKFNLQGVHPDLSKVMFEAIKISSVDFGITEGVRTLDRQKALLADGKTWTLESNHIPDTNDGVYSYAVDIAVYHEGKVSWKRDHFGPALQAIATAAIKLGVQINFGGLWLETVDCPHVELNTNFYSTRKNENV